jgi:1-deoxy-D-xylulose-5-phosphate synthase
VADVTAAVGCGRAAEGRGVTRAEQPGRLPDRPLVVVLNDNGHCYDETVGGFARHLARPRQRS